MDLYKFHPRPDQLDHHDVAHDIVPKLAWKKYTTVSQRKAREDIWAKDALIACEYARLVLGQERFKKGEDAISTNTDASFWYAQWILGSRFEKGEDAISKNGQNSLVYAMHILKGRFEKGEDVIAKDATLSYLYAIYVLNSRFEKGEAAIAGGLLSNKRNYQKKFKVKL